VLLDLDGSVVVTYGSVVKLTNPATQLMYLACYVVCIPMMCFLVGVG
jgi:hypothetical protein